MIKNKQYILSRKPKTNEGSEMFSTKYQYRESLNNGVVRTTPSVSRAETFTEEDFDGISCVYDDWGLIEISVARKRKQFRKFN